MDGKYLKHRSSGGGRGSGLMKLGSFYMRPPPNLWLKGESREFVVINGGLSSGSVAGTLGGQQPGASWGANGFQEQFGKESCKQPKQNITSPGPLHPES